MKLILNEVSRKNLVGKTKVYSKDRWQKRLNYMNNTSQKGINLDELLNSDTLTSQVDVRGNSDVYKVTVQFHGVLKKLKEILAAQPSPTVTLQSIIRAVMKSIDEDEDVKIDCTCPDFKYRFAYVASKYGYKYGSEERRPSNITNPDDSLGSSCKHVIALLSNKKWLTKVSSNVNDFIKEHAEEVRDYLGLSEDEFIINTGAYYLGKASAKKDDKDDYVSRWRDTLNDKNEEPSDESEEQEESDEDELVLKDEEEKEGE